MRLAALAWTAVITVVAAPAYAQEGNFYDVSEKPNTLSLVILDQIEFEPGGAFLPVVDVFRGDRSDGVFQVWRIQCDRREIALLTMQTFGSGGLSDEQEINSPGITLGDGLRDQTLYAIACTDDFELLDRRLFKGSLSDLVEDYWNR